MDKSMLLMFVGAVLVMLFLFTIFFIHILRLLRKSKLQTKIALMKDTPQTATFDQGLEPTESNFEQDFEKKPKKVKHGKSKNNN